MSRGFGKVHIHQVMDNPTVGSSIEERRLRRGIFAPAAGESVRCRFMPNADETGLSASAANRMRCTVAAR